MHLTTQQALAMKEDSLRKFVAIGIKEGLYLDYKEALPEKLDKEAKREFLKDVAAFANAIGGDLLLGVKEPSEGLSVDDQIVGLDDGLAVAHSLERLAGSSIDPRVPGLRIVPIQLASGKFCVVVHVPPSLSRPHMVSHEGHRSFYVRHSESSVPMSTHEIREAALTAASSEERARQFIRWRLVDVQELLNDEPALFIQAMPLIAPESKWDVLNDSFATVLRGGNRFARYDSHYALGCLSDPRPTIDGLAGTDGNAPMRWEVEVHRMGYVSLFYRDIVKEESESAGIYYLLHSNYRHLFHAFCHLLAELMEVATSDVPYLVACTFLNARGARFYREGRSFGGLSAPYSKAAITWPEHLRATGEDPAAIAEALSLEMFNAFGFRRVQ